MSRKVWRKGRCFARLSRARGLGRSSKSVPYAADRVRRSGRATEGDGAPPSSSISRRECRADAGACGREHRGSRAVVSTRVGAIRDEAGSRCGKQRQAPHMGRALRHRVPVVLDGTIFIEETPNDRQEELVRHCDRPDGQAFPWSDTYRDQPIEERPIAELGAVRGLTARLELHSDLDGLSDALNERFDELPIRVGEGDGAAREAAVSCDQAHGIREILTPTNAA